jgi:WD40 repeat protein
LACNFLSGEDRTVSGNIGLLSVADGSFEGILKFPALETVKYMDVSQNGKLLAVWLFNANQKGHPDALGCYSLAQKKWMWRKTWIPPSKGDVPDWVKFSQDGQRITIGSVWSIISLDSSTGETVNEKRGLLKDYPLVGHALRPYYISPSGRYFVIWQEKPISWHNVIGGLFINRWVTVWDLDAGEVIARWRKPKYRNIFAAFSPDEKTVVMGSEGGYLRVWAIESQKLTKEWKVKEAPSISSLLFSPDGRYLAVSFLSGGDLKVFDDLNETLIKDFKGAGYGSSLTLGRQDPMAFSQDGYYFAFLDKGKICLYSTSAWKQQWCVTPGQ